jgi:ABC-type polysaccharide/polyol phosphate export permease
VSVYADLIRYRDLYGNLFRRDLEARYKGSVLGVAWSLANPVLLMAIYLVVFSVIWQASFTDVDHYGLFLLSGLAPWIFFSTSLQTAARSMLDSANLIRKTRFPRQLVPLSVVAANVISFGAMLAGLLALNFALLPRVRATEWTAIPVAALIVCLTAGLALALASLNVLFRDIEHLTAALLVPWFFLTPILYPLSGLPARVEQHHVLVQAIHWGNFVSPAVEALRDPLYAGRLPRAGDVLYLVVAAACSLALGAFVFSRVDDRLAVEL